MERCNIYHSKEKQLDYLQKWCQTTIDYVNEVGGEAKQYIEVYKLDIKRANKEYMKYWVKNVQYFLINQDEFEEVDIRWFLVQYSKNSK